MLFKNDEHKNFFFSAMQKADGENTYQRALFYALGINRDTRNHIYDIYDFKGEYIKPESLNSAWQTSGSTRVTLIAFQLWNGYQDERATIENLFASSDAPYFIEAIRIRFPQYFDDMTE